jgi:hypothetical protein
VIGDPEALADKLTKEIGDTAWPLVKAKVREALTTAGQVPRDQLASAVREWAEELELYEDAYVALKAILSGHKGQVHTITTLPATSASSDQLGGRYGGA